MSRMLITKIQNKKPRRIKPIKVKRKKPILNKDYSNLLFELGCLYSINKFLRTATGRRLLKSAPPAKRITSKEILALASKHNPNKILKKKTNKAIA